MKRAWMAFYPCDYLADTGHLTTLQHGAYSLLLWHYWKAGSLPDDDRQLANITRLSLKDWLINRPTLQAFFHDGWKHKRVEHEMARSEERYAKRAAAGSKGGTVAAINRWRRK